MSVATPTGFPDANTSGHPVSYDCVCHTVSHDGQGLVFEPADESLPE